MLKGTSRFYRYIFSLTFSGELGERDIRKDRIASTVSNIEFAFHIVNIFFWDINSK